MSDHLIISDVSRTLVQLLGDELKGDGTQPPILTPDRVILQSPFKLADGQLSVFLYRILEDAQMKNQPPGLGRGGRVRKAPLTLDLHYMITPHFEDAGTRDIVLGKVLSVLYDHPFLYLADLRNRQNTPREEVRLVLNSVPLEEMARIWEAIQESYQLSLCYIARVALLDSTEEEFISPVLHKRAQYGEPEPQPA